MRLCQVLVLAAALSVQSPFSQRVGGGGGGGLGGEEEEARRGAALRSEDGDPFTLLNVLHEWAKVKEQRGVVSARCRMPTPTADCRPLVCSESEGRGERRGGWRGEWEGGETTFVEEW